MAYVDNNATAWGEVEFKFGAPGAGGAMGTVLKTLGIVKEGSFSIEKEDGNKALLSEIWDIEESGDKLIIKSFVSTKKFSSSIIPKVSGAEKVDIFYCTMAGTLVYNEESGYDLEIEITMLNGGKGYFSIEKVA